MSNEKDIAVVGMACVFPKAANLRQYWSNLVNGVDAIDHPPPGRWSDRRNFRLPSDHEAFLPSDRGGYLPTDLPFDPMPFGVPPNLPRHGDPDQFLMLHVLDAALRDAGVAEDSPLRRRTDVILGRGGYVTGKLAELTFRAEVFDIVLDLLDRQYPDLVGPRRREMEAYLRATLTPREADNVSTGIANITASRAANRLNLRGAAYTVDAACASSLLAVEQAVWRLRTRQCDVAAAGGVFLSLSPTFLCAFAGIGALSPSGRIRPFDRRADGLLAGEGGGAVILKRLEDAIRDGNTIYAIVKGVGSASDGRAVDVLAPSSEGQILALENAYKDAGIDRESIGYLELHGTGTIIGDLTELQTVKSFFGTVDEPASARAMGSVKSMIGHCMPAAGIAAFIKTALALSHKILPPSLHCEEPREELADAPFYLLTQTRPWIHNPAHGPRRAGINAFGFGGINAHIVLEEAGTDLSFREPINRPALRSPARQNTIAVRPIEPALHRATELLVFSAQSEPALREQLLRLERFLQRDETAASLADLASSLARSLHTAHPVKLALVCRDVSHLRQLLQRCRAEIAEDGEAIFYSAEASVPRGKIALLFPGMGFPGLIGNYPDHVLELCLHFPELRAEFDSFEDRDRHPEDTVPTSAVFSPPPSLPEAYRRSLKARLAPPKADEYGAELLAPQERYLAAMGVTLSNWLSWVLLRKFALPVDMIAGQSQGEMAALCAAGVADFHALAPGFWKVLNIDARDAQGRQLAFAWASPEKVAPLLAEEPEAHLAIYASPHSVILGGERSALLRIAEKLRREEILVQLLPYPPIHTPCLSHLRGELVRQLADENVALRPPQVALYSSITSAPYPEDPAGIRDTLLKNVDEPLRVWQTVQRLYEDGARIFVQAGGGHMAAHLAMLLPEGAEAVSVAVDVETRDPLTQLHHLCARLLCAGVPLRLEPLFEGRALREVDLDQPQPAPTPSRFAVPLRIDWSPLKQIPTAHHEAPSETLPPEAQGMPVLGRVLRHLPEKELVLERALDVDEDLYLADHLFVYAKCKPLEERLPILPLTMSLEFAAEAAALLSPGLGLIGFENVRGLRWIGLRDCRRAELRIEARVVSVDADSGVRRIECTIFHENQASFSAIALFADSYRVDVGDEIAEAREAEAWPIAAAEVYGERHMFHGPRFATIAALQAFGNPSASGTLRAMPRDRLFASNAEPLLLTDPCLMDGLGQFVGLWARMHEQYVLPISVEKIEFYAPPPSPGTPCPIRMEVIDWDSDARQMRSNIELEDGAGNVCVRVRGWSDWILNWPVHYERATARPEQHHLAREVVLPDLPSESVCMVVERDDFHGVDLDWASRLFMHTSEMPRFHAAASKERRHQLVLGVVAVKDAVRVWWARKHGVEMPHPAALALGHEESGRPFLAVDADGDWTRPYISLAHTDGGAVALAAEVPVGIDVEDAARETRSLLAEFATREEQKLLDVVAAQQPEENFATRLWCAKEAAGKALGIGLNGRPKDLEALEIEDDGSFLIRYAPSGERLVVRTARVDALLLAWTARQQEMREIASPHGKTEAFAVIMEK